MDPDLLLPFATLAGLLGGLAVGAVVAIAPAGILADITARDVLRCD